MKKIAIGVVIFIMFIMIATNVNASSFSFTASATKTTVAPGEETVITLKVSDIDMGNNGIKTLSGYFEYDEKVFETVKAINGMGTTTTWSWSYNTEEPELGKFAGAILSEGTKNTAAIGAITLKVRADAIEGTTTVSFKDIMSSDGFTDISSNDSSLSLTIKKAEEEETNNTVDNNTINNDTNIADKEYPYTGKSETMGVIIIALIIVSIVTYKMNKNNQRM